jgi:uncharacterized membrane protein
MSGMRYADRAAEARAHEALRRRFDVDVPLEQAWDVLADVESWPTWAPHIRSVTVEPSGPLGPSSSGMLRLRGGMRATFRMAAWEPPRLWAWVGRAGGLTVHYDHRFEPGAEGSTTMVWVVSLSGIGSRLARAPFAFVYGRNVDRAIPQLQATLRAGDRRRS